jgi:tetratricopeptide (TPR) repeat protein
MESPANQHDYQQQSAGRTRWFGDLDDLDFEINFYEQILQRNPNYVCVLRVLAELLSRKGQYTRILEIDRRLVALLPRDEIARYNLACSLTKQGFHSLAIQELAQSLELGYNDFEHLEVDPDLDALRNYPGFAALLNQFRVNEI